MKRKHYLIKACSRYY